MGAGGDWPVVIGLTDGLDSRDDLAEFEIVEDGGLTGGIETNHEDAYFILAESDNLGTARHGENRAAGERGRARSAREEAKIPFKSGTALCGL